MQRYHATSCNSAVNNSAIGGTSARDATRADSNSLLSNISTNSRRSNLLTPYKLKCDKEPLNSRLGPPDFHPQTPNCSEETLTREYVQNGYKETVEGLEEVREISLTQALTFSKPVVLKCREAIRKCLRAINESRAQKRKAGQVYGVPLSGSLLTKPGVFPEQRPCGEDFRKKWIEGLSQQHKRLRSLADLVPHGYRKKSLFEVLIRNDVPLVKATWFIKVTYLNQVRQSSANSSSGASDKIQLSRSELWTKDVIEYLQYLLDEFLSRNNSHSTQNIRDRSSQMFCTASLQQRSDPAAVIGSEEPSLSFKWWYMVRLVQWHQAEGLLLPSYIDWVLNQLKEKESLEILQLLLPIVYGVLEIVVSSQTYVRSLVGIAIHFIREPMPVGSDLVDNSRRAYTISALTEMVRYLILAVPDAFVALDCFPLPSCVVSYASSGGNLMYKASEDARKLKNNVNDAVCLFRRKRLDAQYQSLSFDHVISAIRRHADNLVKSASPGYPTHSVAKAVQSLDKALLQGDVRGAYRHLFEDLCDGALDENWIAEVSPCLRSSLKWFGTVSLSFVCSLFFICEWATCEYRDFRTAAPNGLKFTGKKDFSQIYVAIRLMKQKIRDLHGPPGRKSESTLGINNLAKGFGRRNNYSYRNSQGNGFQIKNFVKRVDDLRMNSSDIFETPGPLHDIIVCWIDQHEVHKRGGVKRVQHFIMELVRAGIFYPQAYVRQLIVSGILDMNDREVNRRRHHHILKQLPGQFLREALEEARVAEGPQLSEAVLVYSNERRLVLRELLSDQSSNVNVAAQKQKHHMGGGRDNASPSLADQRKTIQPTNGISSSKNVKREADIEELKASILVLLQLPNSSATSADSGLDESQGSAKRSLGSVSNKMDLSESTPGCEDCKLVKRQKLSDDRSSILQIPSPVHSDDEDMWWVRKGPKPIESLKADTPLKSTKQVSRGRQKTVRRTQSLAQLAAARIEGSQGASTSHVCDNKVSCPHHKTGVAGETLKSTDGVRTASYGDIVSIGKALKKLRIVEKRTITVWLTSLVRHHIEEAEKSVAKVGQFNGPFVPVDGKGSARWRLSEDELSAILYFMDVCHDLVSAVKFLLWLLPKVLNSSSSTISSGRNVLSRNAENHACGVGEAFLLSSIRRYENVLTATDLIPEALSATMHRATAVMAYNGRVSGSAAYGYARYLLKKYSNVASVIEWEKNFKTTCDKRLLSDFESGRSLDGDMGFPLGVPAGVEDPDDYLRQKINSGRLSRVGSSMRDVVHRHMEEAVLYFYEKERKFFASGSPRNPAIDKTDDESQIAQQIIIGLMDCIRQTGGAAQEGDPSLLSSAVSAIVGNVVPTMAKIHDSTTGSNYQNYPSTAGSLSFSRRILRVHITCLCLLKEALGERQSRVFEIALATEASCALAGVLTSGKASRGPFQSSLETHEPNSNMSNDTSKVAPGRTAKIAAAISSLIIGAVLHGVTSLERLVTVFRFKEGLDVIQFMRSTKSNSNGSARSIGSFKVDNSIEVHLHWFRLLVGNCRTVSDGLVVELLGEPSIVALSRMQRMLPLSLVFPPAYLIFAFVLWRPFILNSGLATREDIHQLYQSLTLAINDAIRHLPFRDVCMRDSQCFYDLVASDSTDAEFAAMLDLNGLDMHLKSMAFVPLRGRLFLNAMIDCKMPSPFFKPDDFNRASGHTESKIQRAETETKLLDKLVHVLDSLQPAKFHWQWVELRLLLNEQALMERLENHDMSLADCMRSLSPSPEKVAASENENNFINIILTRLLVRPDAAPLFSELVHLFGRSLEDSMLLQAKWFLGGHDVLFGRKTIRQRLINIAESKGLSTKAQFWKPWGWVNPVLGPGLNRGTKKLEVTSLEEGEVVEDSIDSKRHGKGSSPIFYAEGTNISQQHVTERAFIELVLPCIDQSTDDSRNTFASDLIKQLNNIEQQINAVTRGANKLAGLAPSGIDASTNKGSSRKSVRGGSPGLARRPAATADPAPPSPAALRASMSLRLQFLLRLLPIIYADGEPSGRNMKHMLASVILRLLGSRVVHEDADLSFYPMQNPLSKREVESPPEAPPVPSSDILGESLFDRLLSVFYGLLSSCQPSWLRTKPAPKSNNNSSKDFSGSDREIAESLQNDLDRMQLPDSVRWRIQAAMPILLPSVRCSLTCQPPTVPGAALASLQPSISVSGASLNPPQRNSVPLARSATNSGKSKPLPLQQDNDMEIDPWTLLEDGAGSGPSSSNTAAIGGGDQANLRAASWLKGAIRVRRTDLTYIGAVDDDS